MANDKKNAPAAEGPYRTPAPGAKNAAEALFDAAPGQEIFTDRPIINWEGLGDHKRPIIGWLVLEQEMNLPKGAAPRADGKDYWNAFAIHLTQPTVNVTEDGEIVEIPAGREVFFACNKTSDFLRNFLGKPEMSEMVVLGTDLKDLGRGRNPMQNYRIKPTGRTMKREGAFLMGGPGMARILRDGSPQKTASSAGALVTGETISQIENGNHVAQAKLPLPAAP